MHWFDFFDFLLFDFDGLLVDTEQLHFKAYKKMLEKQGCQLEWSFEKYCSLAHADAKAVQNAIYSQFPLLKKFSWQSLYQQKKDIYLKLLSSSKINLMPGVEPLLKKIGEKKKKSCVVTHSLKELTDAIRRKNPLLQHITHWVTRDDYQRPKPFADGYLKAIELYGRKQPNETGAVEKIIGFEDTIRGLKALQEAKQAVAVLICKPDHPQMEKVGKNVLHFTSFPKINSRLVLEKAR